MTESAHNSSINMELGSPVKVKRELLDDSSSSPTVSRYGRSHKPKMQEDFVSTDKKVSAYLKISPGNRIQNFSMPKEVKKRHSPKKFNSDSDGTPKRGRPPKTPNKNSPDSTINLKAVKLEPQNPSEAVDGCEWMVGDLAWARVGAHPFWPCIIAVDPTQKIFTKTMHKGRGSVSQRWIHVQFFGDNGRRSWLNVTSIMSYNGRDAFVQLGETILAGMRKKEPKQTAAFVIKPAVIQVWEKAVQEAEDLINASREERVAFFTLHFPPSKPDLTEELTTVNLETTTPSMESSTSPVSSQKKRGRKRKTLVEEEIKKKQVKTEEDKDLSTEKLETSDKVDSLTSPPRTIADRKKRQALLMQLARSSDVSVSVTPISPAETPASHSMSTPTVKKETPTTSTPKETPMKRPASAESTDPVEVKKPKRKYDVKKKKYYSFKAYCDFKFDRMADEHPELTDDDINKYLKKEWNKMSDSDKERYASKKSKVSEKGNSDSTDNSSEDAEGTSEEEEEEETVIESSSKDKSPAATPVSTNLTPSAQKTTATKRNISKSLFSGAKAEKVCLICEKVGDTVRCRGPCQGFYHPLCVTNSSSSVTPAAPAVTPIVTPGKGKRGRPKKKSLANTSLISVGVSQSSQSSLSSQTSDSNSSNSVESSGTDEVKSQSSLSNQTSDCNSVKTLDTVISEADSGVDLTANSEQEEKMNAIAEKENISSTQKKPVVQVIEPTIKMRKNSKDTKDLKDKDCDSNSNSGEEGETFRCKDCQEGTSQPCFECNKYVHEKTGEAKLYRCNTAYCGKVYHEECLKKWPQCSWRTNGNGKNYERSTVICPQHTCHTCASDNPGVIKARYCNDKLVRCIRCPTTYHYGNYCLPAGSEVLTNTQIICPRHYKPLKKTPTQHINAAWCFICASGGSLICCDLCPTAFHADCLNISTPPDGSYVCEDCVTGRFPLYGEIVWVKLGAYRWWPAEILYPGMIPENIMNLPHTRGEFAVKFFGSHDHYWVNRGRVFLYQDGDSVGKAHHHKKSAVDNVFVRAVKEASEAQRKYLEDKATRDAENRPGMKPPNYVKLKTNKPVGNVRTVEMNLSSLTPCECDPNKENPCAPESDCLNRILMVECHPQVCPAGEKCGNQMFEKRLYPPLQPYHTQGRGWGLKTLVPIKKGDFVIEYVGEVINEEEYKRRMVQMHQNNEENFYFLTIDKDRMLDAGPKGNVSRFMNHSCQPNCETQKWTVSGDTRVGLFALCDIPADTELVFNYNLESIGTDKKPCMCGAPNCSGFIGVKANKNLDKEKDENKEKKPAKKKKSLGPSKTTETKCFVCRQPGELLACDGKICPKAYHLACVNKKQPPQVYWLCPWHQCNVCNKGRVQRCAFCVNSFCQEHAEGNIRIDEVRGAVCIKHDQEKSTCGNEDAQTQHISTDKSGDGERFLIKVNGNSSEISTASKSLTAENCVLITKVESTNTSNPNPVTIKKVEAFDNNNIKSINTNSPLRRTRRSQSGVDFVVNGSVEKIKKRKSRPSSVDDKFIISCEKTETNFPKTESRRKSISQKNMNLTEEYLADKGQ